MRHLPIFLDVAGKRVVVVGSGVPAARRAETLLNAGAEVVIFAEAAGRDISDLQQRRGLSVAARAAEHGDFAGAALCIVATESESGDRTFAALARQAGLLVNVANNPALCDFVLPSIVDRDPLVVAISTGGASPLLGRMLKARLEATIPAAFGRLADFVRAQRARVNERLGHGAARRRF